MSCTRKTIRPMFQQHAVNVASAGYDTAVLLATYWSWWAPCPSSVPPCARKHFDIYSINAFKCSTLRSAATGWRCIFCLTIARSTYEQHTAVRRFLVVLSCHWDDVTDFTMICFPWAQARYTQLATRLNSLLCSLKAQLLNGFPSGCSTRVCVRLHKKTSNVRFVFPKR